MVKSCTDALPTSERGQDEPRGQPPDKGDKEMVVEDRANRMARSSSR
jgi:hypothetical protein